MGLIGVDTQVTELHLRLRPGQSERALEGAGVAILVRQFQCLLARGGDDGGENDAGGGSGRNAHGAPQAHDGIEHGADVLAERRAVDNRNGIVRFAVAPDELRAVGLVFAESPTVSPSTAVTCASQTGVSLSDCRRRVASSAPHIGVKFGFDE